MARRAVNKRLSTHFLEMFLLEPATAATIFIYGHHNLRKGKPAILAQCTIRVKIYLETAVGRARRTLGNVAPKIRGYRWVNVAVRGW
jgi:hypothetical protein